SDGTPPTGTGEVREFGSRPFRANQYHGHRLAARDGVGGGIDREIWHSSRGFARPWPSSSRALHRTGRLDLTKHPPPKQHQRELITLSQPRSSVRRGCDNDYEHVTDTAIPFAGGR